MAGCGRLAAGVRNPGQPPQRQRRNVQRWPPQVPPPSNPAARWPCRADTDRIARPPGRNRHRRGVRSPVNSPRLADTTADTSAPAQPLQIAVVRHVCRTPDRRCGTCVGHPLSTARPADRSVSTGTTTADMTVEAAAEGPQRFRPGGGTGTGCRTPDRSGSHPPLDTPSARRTTWPHTGQDARSSGRSIRRSSRLVTTSSTLPHGRPCGRPPAVAVLGRQRPPEPRQRPHSDKATCVPIQILQEATYRLLPNLLQGRSAPPQPDTPNPLLLSQGQSNGVMPISRLRSSGARELIPLGRPRSSSTHNDESPVMPVCLARPIRRNSSLPCPVPQTEGNLL
jgi:hypothetical protein